MLHHMIILVYIILVCALHSYLQHSYVLCVSGTVATALPTNQEESGCLLLINIELQMRSTHLGGWFSANLKMPSHI